MNCANHPDRERSAFCQNCGKPLCAECTRTIGSAVFCEPCLAARLAAADAANPAATPYGTVPGYTAPIPTAPGAPNPILAGALGFVPGVAAMYNGQYAKGVVHLVIFALLVSLADNNGAFGILVAGWIFYQVFEGYHTARARRDGTPLPNPFGLNDIGEKLGFNKSWAAPTGPTAPFSPDPSTAQPQPGAPFTATPFTQAPYSAPPYTAPYTPPYAPPYTQPAAPWGAPTDTYAPIPPYPDPYADPPTPPSRFPVGAILLIAFGVLFFFGSSGLFRHFPVQRVIPFLLIALGVWIFVRKMTATGTLADDGTPAYRFRLFRALRGSVWIILVGVLFFLDTFDILSWGHSWPLFIILAGLMTVFERAAAPAVPAYPYPPAPGYPAAPAPPAPPAPTPGTSIVPATPYNEEGR